MIKKVKKIAKTDLVKTSFFSAIATAVRIFTGFVYTKVAAIYLGPVGVALLGQLANFMTILATVGSGGINSGVVKYIAEDRKNENNSRKVISTAFIITALCSLLTGGVVFVFAGYFSNLIFKTQQYKFVVILISLTLLFSSLSQLFLQVLNGYKEIVKYTLINIVSSLLVLTVSVWLMVQYKITGILVATAMGQLVVFIITVLFIVRLKWFEHNYLLQYFDRTALRNLSKYSLMALVTAFTVPVALLVVRNYIGAHLSWEDAGYWQGVYNISDVYLSFITGSLAVYYLPRLSEITDKKELRNEIINSAKIIMPLVSFIALFVFLIKGTVVNVLFTDKFTPMLPLFKYQLLGDVVKIASWLIAFQMLSKAMTTLFIVSEIVFSVSYVGLSIFLVKHFGLEGAAMAFALNYTLYLVFMLFVFRKSLFTQHE